jgi:hypothetical protein
MSLKDHARQILEQRLAQARRLAREPVDELTKERIRKLIRELEDQLNDHPLQPREWRSGFLYANGSISAEMEPLLVQLEASFCPSSHPNGAVKIALWTGLFGGKRAPQRPNRR